MSVQESLAEQVLHGSRRALARLITQVENETQLGRDALKILYPHTGRAHIVGVTGAPGSGKSTLTNEMAKEFRRSGETVGIVAIDPTSPFSGGALLGDRIRMRDLSGDSGIFIRSMASRGSLGGLARATGGVVKLLDAAGYHIVMVETVGAGQAEVDIAKASHTTIVVQAPGMGDDIQAIKAGILEIADVFAVNKADRPGAESTVKALQMMQRLGNSDHLARERHHGEFLNLGLREQATSDSYPARNSTELSWDVPIQPTVATRGKGVAEVVASVRAHREYLIESGEWHLREAARVEIEFAVLLRDALLSDLLEKAPADYLGSVFERLVAREIDPYSAVAELVRLR